MMKNQCSDEEILLGDDQIDASHRQFFLKLNQTIAADGQQFVVLFNELNQHLIQHFSEEDTLMNQCDFSASAEHQGEHRRVLGEMKQFKRQVERGRLQMARAYLAENFTDWFRLHLTTMDSALVVQLEKQN